MLRSQCRHSMRQTLPRLKRFDSGVAWRRGMTSTAATVEPDGTQAAFTCAKHALLQNTETTAVQVAASGACLAKPLLLVSDLDDTLLPCNLPHHTCLEEAAAAFKSTWERSRRSDVPCKLVINTGRTLPLFEEAWNSQGAKLLPTPDICITGVGTRIYHNTPTGWLEDKQWTVHMDKGWDSSKAQRIMDGLIQAFGESSVVYRAANEMHEHKLTIHYKAVLQQVLMQLLHEQLEEAHIRATVIEGSAFAGWRFVDLLPQHAGKGTAMQYVQERLGFDEASTVASGDAMNDLLMLQQARLSIIVGNGVPEIKQWAESVNKQHGHYWQPQQTQHNEQQQQRQQVYLAKAPVAAGVLEGLHALGFLQPSTELLN